MASVEEIEVISSETGAPRRSKNVAKRGRGRKRGAAAVSTRSTRSKKSVPNSQDSEEDMEEEVEDASQNETEGQDDQEVSELDVSNDPKNVPEKDVIKNGVEETDSLEVDTSEKPSQEKKIESSVKKGADKSEEDPLSESNVANENNSVKNVADEKTDGVKDSETVSENKGPSTEKKTTSSEDSAVKELKTKRDSVKNTPATIKDKPITSESNDNATDKVITIKDDEAVTKDKTTDDKDNVVAAKDNKSAAKEDADAAKSKSTSVKDKAAAKDTAKEKAKDKAKDKATTVKDKVATIKDKVTATKDDTSKAEAVVAKDKDASEDRNVAKDDATSTKEKGTTLEDESAAVEENKIAAVAVEVSKTAAAAVEDSKTVAAAVEDSKTAAAAVEGSKSEVAVVEDNKSTLGKKIDEVIEIDVEPASETVPVKGGDEAKQNDKTVKNAAEGPASVASGQTKPPENAVGSPLEVDISQYTVLEETNTSQGSADERGDETMDVDDKKEREQSPEVGEMKNASMDDMTVIDEVEDEGDEKEDGVRESKTSLKNQVHLDDTEMVSEDELPTETAKEPETEAVSDEELPEPTASGDLPETEAVSEDELPPEKTEKKKTDSEVETPSESAADQAKKKRKARFDGQKRKLAEGDTYDPSSPTSENSCDETPAKRAALSSGGADGKAKQSAKGRKALPELEKYWKAVKEDASDFTGWTYLLQYVDQENDIDAAREAYDAFLSHYPYCYGYWRKYADYEKRKGNKEKCEEVFDRGLKAIPLSVDLWIHYLHYCKTAYSDNEEFLRAQFERALTACGMEFRSDRLWESYIKWETEGKRLQNVTAIYDRLLNMPTQGYTSHFENFQEHVSNNAPQKVLSVDEFLSLRREVLQLLKQYDSPGTEDAAPGDEVEAPPGEEPEEKPSVSDEETTALRERIVSLRRKVHKATVAAVADRWNFEEGIKRPYFHVKPLERCQLKNWKEYLDFEIEKGDKERIITLFERCLIACALYEEFWLKFVRYLESEKNDEMVEKIGDVYERACTIHHPKKPNLHLHWSVFEESHKNYDKAAEILTNLEKAVPNLVQVSYRRINLERRRGNLDKVCSLYEHYITSSKNKVISNNMAIKYARFCWKVKSDVDKAVSILNKALEKDKENPRLYLQLIDMGMQRQTLDEAEIISTIDLFLSRDVDPEQKVLFAQRKVEFLEDFSSDIVSVQKSHDEFLRYCKQIKERKKKSAEETKSESASKKSKSGSGDSASQHASHTTQSHTTGQAAQGTGASSQGTASQYATQSYGQSNYSQAPPTQGGYQSGQYAGSQPGPYSQAPYNQQYSQSGDPSYAANYQNWGYSQPGYGGYNQGWGNYNYY